MSNMHSKAVQSLTCIFDEVGNRSEENGNKKHIVEHETWHMNGMRCSTNSNYMQCEYIGLSLAPAIFGFIVGLIIDTDRFFSVFVERYSSSLA